MLSSFLSKASVLLLCVAGLSTASNQNLTPSRFTSSPIKNHYIVQYRDGVDYDARYSHETQVRAAAGKFGKYRGVIKSFNIGHFSGYHGEFDAAHVKRLNHSGLIKSIENDATIHISSVIPLMPHQVRGINSLANNNIVRAGGATWGQARLSHRLPGSGADYIYEHGGSTVYVVDSGIKLSHHEFGDGTGASGRVTWGANFINNVTGDQHGHGTHVAGTVGGLTYGISPKSRLVALKVIDGNGYGTWSGVAAAIQWACDDTAARNASGLSVINMSIGGPGKSQFIYDAISGAVAKSGITVVAAAGNWDGVVNDGSVTPAGCGDVIAVGAIDGNDTRSSYSNWGPGVTVFAPGDGIRSAWFEGDDYASGEMSGTSMASPHVAGLAAYFMELYGKLTPADVKQRILAVGTRDKVKDAGDGSPNLIAYNGNPVEFTQTV
ncbi:serine protease [Apodospora peruviana]|uniref:Serine protease n=1 Tax=Apodospora peruviana TaxID=516989 RepID=A0AAE0ISS5_9PEZI|nr:serine protease [Apodospora peruviana]